MSNTNTNANASAAMTAQSLKLIKRGGAIYAPLPDEYTDHADTLLCTRNEHGEAVVPREAGEDLNRCLYDLRNSSTSAGKLPDGTTVELDGQTVGHFESCHFIPAEGKIEVKRGHVINCCAQQIHEDSKIRLSENDRRDFGGARFVDALTFVRKHPQKYLAETFIIGTRCYFGDALYLGQEDKTAFQYNVPQIYAMNGWTAGSTR